MPLQPIIVGQISFQILDQDHKVKSLQDLPNWSVHVFDTDKLSEGTLFVKVKPTDGVKRNYSQALIAHASDVFYKHLNLNKLLVKGQHLEHLQKEGLKLLRQALTPTGMSKFSTLCSVQVPRVLVCSPATGLALRAIRSVRDGPVDSANDDWCKGVMVLNGETTLFALGGVICKPEEFIEDYEAVARELEAVVVNHYPFFEGKVKFDFIRDGHKLTMMEAFKEIHTLRLAVPVAHSDPVGYMQKALDAFNEGSMTVRSEGIVNEAPKVIFNGIKDCSGKA